MPRRRPNPFQRTPTWEPTNPQGGGAPVGRLGAASGAHGGRGGYGRPGQDIGTTMGGKWVTIEGRHVFIKDKTGGSDELSQYAQTGEATVQDVADQMEGGHFTIGKMIGSRRMMNLNDTYTA